MKFRTIRKTNYLTKSAHKKGHGIHSPFLFRLITEVIENKGFFYAYTRIDDARESILKSMKSIDLSHLLSRKFVYSSTLREGIKKRHSISVKYAKLIFRLVNEFQPSHISYFGLFFDLTPVSLALADSRINVSVDLLLESALKPAQAIAEIYSLQNIIFQRDITVVTDFTFINLPFDSELTERILRIHHSSPGENGVIIVRGIHDSPEMENCWKRIVKEDQVRISLDLFEVGILFYRKALQKENFVLRF